MDLFRYLNNRKLEFFEKLDFFGGQILIRHFSLDPDPYREFPENQYGSASLTLILVVLLTGRESHPAEAGQVERGGNLRRDG